MFKLLRRPGKAILAFTILVVPLVSQAVVDMNISRLTVSIPTKTSDTIVTPSGTSGKETLNDASPIKNKITAL